LEAEAAKARIRAEVAEAHAQAARVRAEAAQAEVRAAQAEVRAAAVEARAVLEQRIGRIPGRVWARIASASLVEMIGWLGEIALKNSVDSLLATGQGDGETHIKGAGEHSDAPEDGAQDSPEP
jgi:uncharacterized protein YqfA (UPF0365 family)